MNLSPPSVLRRYLGLITGGKLVRPYIADPAVHERGSMVEPELPSRGGRRGSWTTPPGIS